MSTQPPDRPTEPLRPRAPVVDERVPPPGADPNYVLLRLEDSVRSLRSGLMVVGAIAIAALGVAIYALASDDETSNGGGSRAGLASDARVSRIDERVDKLSRQVQDLRSGGANSDLADRVEELETKAKDLESRDDPSQAIEDLSTRIDTLENDIEQLQQAQP